MENQSALHALLSLDIGSINTRASYFGILGGKFQLQAAGKASTSQGEGFQLGSGAGASMQDLQRRSEVHILKPNGELIWPYYDTGLGLDRIAVTISSGPKLRTVILGLTEDGSLKIGRALAESLPLSIIGVYGLTALLDQPSIVDTLAALCPEVVIFTGGENGGAQEPIEGWIDILKLVCQVLPDEIKPDILFAGNALLESSVKRYIEPVANLVVVPNLQPDREEMDLVQAQAALDKIIISRWQEMIPGFKDLISRTKAMTGTRSFTLGRMVRYLSLVNEKSTKGIFACDLGGCSTTAAAGLGGKSAVITQPVWDGFQNSIDADLVNYVHQWTAAEVSKEDVQQHLSNHALTPSFVPENNTELAIVQAYARYRLHMVSRKLSEYYPFFSYNPDNGLTSHFEPIIASGEILTGLSSMGQSMQMVMDGLQPWGVTTIVLDRYHILPLLGLIGAQEPVLPTHVLASDAFESLGTVVTAVAPVPEDTPVLNIEVKAENAKDYEVEILQGSLKRLVIPTGVTAELTLRPSKETDIGFGGPGIGGRLKVPGGSLGVVIDARGRPLRLPEADETRIEALKRWQLILGG
jgi:hypothetical protein